MTPIELLQAPWWAFWPIDFLAEGGILEDEAEGKEDE